MKKENYINREYERGNILLSSLLIMLAMNILGITLLQTSVREFSTANFKTIDSTNFYLAETCIQDGVKYFEEQSKPPANIPSITRENLSHMYLGSEDQSTLNQLSKYSYNCDITEITTKSVLASDSGEGDNIGTGDEYGVSGDLSPKYFYQVDSSGSGPNNSEKRITSILSVEY